MVILVLGFIVVLFVHFWYVIVTLFLVGLVFKKVIDFFAEKLYDEQFLDEWLGKKGTANDKKVSPPAAHLGFSGNLTEAGSVLNSSDCGMSRSLSLYSLHSCLFSSERLYQ